MQLITANQKEYKVKSVSTSINTETFRKNVEIQFDSSVKINDIVDEFKKEGFDSFTVANGEDVKSYSGYGYMVSLSERFDEFGLKTVLNLSDTSANA